MKYIQENREVLCTFVNRLDNNESSGLIIELELSDEVSNIIDLEPVFQGRMNNQSIIGILTQLLYFKESTEYLVRSIEYCVESPRREITGRLFETSYYNQLELVLKYRNRNDEYKEERDVLLKGCIASRLCIY